MRNAHKSSVPPSRRRFLKSAAIASAFAAAPLAEPLLAKDTDPLPEAFATLKPLGSRIRPISAEEYRARLQHAQKLMTEPALRYDAFFVAPGTSLYYFTGIRWGMSERLLALVLPRKGDPIIVVPAFEEGRMREKLQFPAEVRIWQEDQSPTKMAAAALADRGFAASSVARRLSAIRQLYRFLLAEGHRKDDPAAIIEGPRRGRPLPKVLSVAEVDRLIATARQAVAAPRATGLARLRALRLVCLLELLYASGLRISELIALPASAASRSI